MSICTKNPTQLTSFLSGAGAKHAFQVKGLRLFMMLCFAIAGLAASAPSAQAQVSCPRNTTPGTSVLANSNTSSCVSAADTVFTQNGVYISNDLHGFLVRVVPYVSGISPPATDITKTCTGAGCLGIDPTTRDISCAYPFGPCNISFSYNDTVGTVTGSFTVAQTTSTIPAFVVNGGAFVLDTTAPTVAITGVPATTDGSTPFTATFTFDEDVTGFDAVGDITVANGAASAFATSTANRVFTATITPNGAGDTSVSVLANVAQDAASNANVASNVETATLAAPPGVPTNVQFDTFVPYPAASRSWIMSWDAPASDGGSPITAYPFSIHRDAICGTPLGGGTFNTSPTFELGSQLTAAIALGASDVSFKISARNANGDSEFSTCVTRSVDVVAPTLTAVSIASNNANTAKAKDGDAITVSITSDEALDTPPVVTIYGGGATVTGSGTSWSAVSTVDGTSPEGAAAINISGFKDAAGNTGTAVIATTDGSAVEVDRTAPQLTGIYRPGIPLNTNVDSVGWQFTFDEAVQNVSVDDFIVTGTTATVTSVRANSSTFYAITVAGGDLNNLNGTISIGFAAGQDIQDLAGNALANTAPTGTNNDSYNISNQAPMLASVTRVDSSTEAPVGGLTNADDLAWNLTFSSISNQFALSSADFTLTGSTANVYVSRYSIGFIVRAVGGDLANLDGDVTLGFSGTSPEDEFGNVFSNKTASGVSELTYTLDNTAPTISSIDLFPGQVSPTDSDFISWGVRFSEDVTLDSNGADFVFSGLSTASKSASNVSDGFYEVSTANGDLINFNGTVSVSLASGQTITDKAGNSLVNTSVSGTNNNSIQVVNDTVPDAPSSLFVTGVLNPNPDDSATSRVSLSWDVSADDGGSVITRQDVSIYSDEFCASPVYTGAIGLPSVTSADLPLDLAAFSVGAKPSFTIQAVNAVGSSTPSNCVSTTIPVADTTPPTLTNVSITSNNADSEWAKSGDVITLTLQADEPLAGAPRVTIASQLATVTGSGVNWIATTTVSEVSIEGQVEVIISTFQDTNGNLGTAVTSTTDRTNVIIDVTRPTVSSTQRKMPVERDTNADSLTFTVNFSEPMINMSRVDFRENSGEPGDPAPTSISSTTGQSVDVTFADPKIANMNRLTEVTVSALKTATDRAGNQVLQPNVTGTREAYNVDNTVPFITSIVRIAPTDETTDSDTLYWRVNFNEFVSNFDSSIITVTGTTASVLPIPTTENNSINIRLRDGDLENLIGPVSFSINGTQNIRDRAGNKLVVAAPTGANESSYNVVNDIQAPSLQSVSISSNNKNADLAASDDIITLAIEIDEALGVAPTVTIAGEVATVTGSDTSWSAALNVSGSMPLGLAAISISNLQDTAGNINPGPFTTTTDSSSVTIGQVPDAVTNPMLISLVSPSPQFAGFPNASNLSEVSFSWVNGDLNGPTDTVFTPLQFDSFRGGGCSGKRISKSGHFFGSTQGEILLNRTGSNGIGPGETASLNIVIENDFGLSAPSTCLNFVIPDADTIPPTLVSVQRKTPSDESTDADSLTWIVTFSEEVINVDASDFTFLGTSASATVTTINPTVYSASTVSATVYEVTASGGDLASVNGTVSLAFSGAQNIADRTASNVLESTVPSGANETYQLVNDTTAPTLTSIIRENPTSATTNADTLTWTVTFSENVQNVDPSDFEIDGTTASLAVSGNGAIYEVVASGGHLAGLGGGMGGTTVSLALAAAPGIQDGAGNALTNTGPSGTVESYAVNNGAPMINTITRVDTVTEAPTPQLTNNDSLAWNVQFGVISGQFGLTPADFTLTGTTATITSVTRYSIGFIVRADGGDLAGLNGDVTLGFSATTPTDEFGNVFSNKTPTGANETGYTLDNTAPALVSIVPGSGTVSPTDADTLSFIFTYSEDLDPSSLNVSNGLVTGTTADVTLTPLSASVARVTLSGGDLADLNGTVTVSLNPTNSIADPAGNLLASVTPTGTNNNAVVVQNDVTAPTVTITSGATDPVSGAFTATFTFSEVVTGFALGDITVGNGSASAFNTTSSTVYTALITPAADGAVTVDVAAAAAQDSAGNDNLAATQFSITNDGTAPTVAITSGATDPVSGAFTATFTFSEAVTGFALGDITVGNGSASAFNTTSATVYTALITPAADGAVTVDVAAAAAQDSAGNDNLAATQFSIMNDTSAPTVTASTPPTSVNGPFDIVFTFTEDVTGLTASDFNVENGTVTLTGGPRDFTATITPDGNGDISVNLPANVATDAAGNGNDAFTANFQVEFDVTAPTVTASTPPSSVNGPFDIVFTFTEDVTGLTASDFNVENGTVTLTGGPRDFTVTITPDGNGDISVNLPANVATDAAGNGNDAFTANFQVEFDATAPTVTTSTPPSSVNGPFDIVFTFTEDVTGLTASDFNVENGTVTLTGGPRDFTVTITPDGNGDISVNLPANVATDAAGNGNDAFTAVIDVNFDVTAPTLVLSTASSDVTGPFMITATFSEVVRDFTAEDISVENGTLSDFSGSDTVFTATVTPVTIGEIVISVADAAAFDLAGNTSIGDRLSATAGGGDAVVKLEVTTAVVDASTVGAEFTLSNPGTQPISFSATSDQPWVDVTPGSGKIESLSNIDFNIQLNDLIDDLAPGTYVALVTVEVVDGSAAFARDVTSKANAITRNILAEVPVTVEIEERFGNFELIVLTPSGPTDGASFQYTSNITALNGLSVAASEGQRRTSLADLLQGAYTIQQSVPDGYLLKSITCSGDTDSGTVVNIQAATVNLDLDASESISCIFENVRNDDAIRIATQRAIRNFMARRGDRVLEATPDLSKRFANRHRKEGGHFMATGSEFRTNMDFETSLSGFRNKAAENDEGPRNDRRKHKSNNWDLWMSAEYTRYEDERADSGIDGKFLAAQFGADYLLKENLIVGAMVQYDWMSEYDKEPAQGLGTSVGADVSGEGLMAGPYLVWRAKEQLIIDVMGLWGSSENEVNPLGYYSDQFETDRFLVRANVTGEFASGPWRLRPQVSLSHYQDKQAEYVDSLGIAIPDQTISIGRLRAGPEVVWTHQTKKGAQLEIGGSVRAVWNYNGAGLMDQSGFVSGGSDPVRADGDISIGTRFANGVTLRASAGFDGIGKGDFSARSGRLEFVFPFGGKGRKSSARAANPLQQAGFHRACESNGLLQSMNRAVPAACDTPSRTNLLDTNIALMARD